MTEEDLVRKLVAQEVCACDDCCRLAPIRIKVRDAYRAAINPPQRDGRGAFNADGRAYWRKL